ncbi:cilia- and flagella-associated protein 90 [Labrus mixtus]|uniref:cilia- and flagella-associated protein 90 n=1 Tax=Labrus mixtus TaxID=508554 RepID=UPI0029C077FC|nr:cilia- and flagella-associated protein 90 [Labrus mixtus]
MDVYLEAQTKPIATISAFSHIPPRREGPKEMSYFNRDSKAPEISTYDRVFHQAEGHDMRLHRDDRKHDKGRGLDIHEEEKARVVPVRSSAEYGRHPVPDIFKTNPTFKRVASTKADFFMKNGITWTVEEGYGSVVPS